MGEDIDDDITAALEAAAEGTDPETPAEVEHGSAALNELASAGIRPLLNGTPVVEPAGGRDLLRSYLEFADIGRDGLIGLRRDGYTFER